MHITGNNVDIFPSNIKFQIYSKLTLMSLGQV